jgi:V8-like Glu-specific endopeptidase
MRSGRFDLESGPAGDRGRFAVSALATSAHSPDEAIAETKEGSTTRGLAVALGRTFLTATSVPLYGTAWMIGPRTLVTAAHNVWRAGEPHSVEFALGHNGRLQDAAWRSCSYAWVPSTWKRNPVTGNPADFGVLDTEDEMPVEETGYFGFAASADAELDRATINAMGYRGVEHNDFRNFWTTGQVISPKRSSVEYAVLNGGGMSGGPLYVRYGDDVRFAVGIHRGVVTDSYGTSDYCVATRINDVVYDLIADRRDNPGSS